MAFLEKQSNLQFLATLFCIKELLDYDKREGAMAVMLCHPCAYSSLSGPMNILLVDIKSKDFRQSQPQKTDVFYTATFVSPQLKHKNSCV